MKLPKHVVHMRYCGCRTFMDNAATTIKFVRDRGLDHAVEREKNLRPLLNVKNLIKSEPSKSLLYNLPAQRILQDPFPTHRIHPQIPFSLSGIPPRWNRNPTPYQADSRSARY
ncbi:hypothetical protein CRYUN_Cryun25bG0044200 [Craigia yunnanensis]